MIEAKIIDEYISRKRYRQINSILVWQEGELCVERYYNGFNRESRNVLRSVSKSIVSIAAGICLARGMIKSLDEPIYHYLPIFSKGLHPFHKLITIKHLLTMSSGIYWVGGVHYHCPLLIGLRQSKDWVSYIADIAVVNVPGTKYNYSEFDFILLTAVLEQAIGKGIFELINEHLYKPLGIKSGPWWQSPGGVTYSIADGGVGNQIDKKEHLSDLTATEMLRIGQLFLQGGKCNGQKIVSKEYVKKAITPSQASTGYGFFWWIGEDWYACHGFGGQNITVMPKKNRIFVMQASPTARGMFYDDVLQLVRHS